MNTIIFTDGSNTHNGKPHSFGGYGFIIEQEDGTQFEGGGSMPVNESCPVTNNRAELLAIIESIKHAQEKVEGLESIKLFSDSQWCVKCAKNEWKKRKNMDLWNEYNNLIFKLKMSGIKYSIEWVKGHIGIELNERADQLAGYYASLAKPV